MKESFEHDARRNFDWKEGTSESEKEKLVQHLEGEGFYKTFSDESVAQINDVRKAFDDSKQILDKDSKNTVLSQLESHKMQFKEEYDEFVKNDEQISEIKKELERMNLTVKDLGTNIEFHDPVMRDQFEEMTQTYTQLVQRNIQIMNKINTLINTLN